MIVYVLKDNDYRNSFIYGVFSSAQIAEQYAELYKLDPWEIGECNIDNPGLDKAQ